MNKAPITLHVLVVLTVGLLTAAARSEQQKVVAALDWIQSGLTTRYKPGEQPVYGVLLWNGHSSKTIRVTLRVRWLAGSTRHEKTEVVVIKPREEKFAHPYSAGAGVKGFAATVTAAEFQ